MQRIRVVTYNIHKCQGMDRRIQPTRIVEVLREIDADLIGLQEVLSLANGVGELDQARYISEHLEFEYHLGETRKHKGAAYGNVILSRFPITAVQQYDLSMKGLEKRGCLRADIKLKNAEVLHLFNVHLGTSYLERRYQARKLVETIVPTEAVTAGKRIVVGDFNEWTRGLTTRLMSAHLKSADIKLHLQRTRTYPGLLPLMHLDHIYYDDRLEVEKLYLHRSRRALIASDHLPLIADFAIPH
ncbi:MAG: endonuclease/exonuclease/phosphatase family protein [Acidobacteria bacterium]|nr:endonuclease/exonuclease/phosphatase family protein [Acidobacteriota bacterium]